MRCPSAANGTTQRLKRCKQSVFGTARPSASGVTETAWENAVAHAMLSLTARECQGASCGRCKDYH